MRVRTTILVALLSVCAVGTLPAQAAGRKGSAAAAKRKSRAAPKTVEVPQKKDFDPVSATSVGTAPVGGASQTAAAGAPPPGRGPTRLDFDDRLIQGQTNKSGAVYLYDRKELKNRSMIKKRESFRSEIIGAVYDDV